MSSLPKAQLFYSPASVWSAVVRLAIDEKGYGPDELDLKVVDLAKGENFSPTFLRLNPKATVPTLVVPLEKTLSEDVESRYKALTDTKAILDFLDKSRSPLSRTHTTSTAPAPSLAPATIAFTTTSNAVIEQLHSERANPNRLMFYAAVDESALAILANKLLPLVQGRFQSLTQLISDAQSNTIKVSERVQTLWQSKRESDQVLLDVFSKANISTAELDAVDRQKREEYLATARDAWQVGIKTVLQSLGNDLVGPYVLGDHLSLADLHLAGWLTRVFTLAGVQHADSGDVAISKVSSLINGDVSVKFSTFWETIKARESWNKVYSNKLF